MDGLRLVMIMSLILKDLKIIDFDIWLRFHLIDVLNSENMRG